MRRAAVFLALVGCSATPPPAPLAPRAAAVAPAGPAIVRARADAGSYERSLSGLAGRGDLRFVAGNLRALVEDGRVTLADDRTAQPIADAVEVDGSWVFVDYGGAVTASEGFLGALRPVGRVPVGATTNPWSRGRVASVRAGRLWLCDGRTVTEAQVPGAPVAAAAFESASVGVVVHRDGALSVTDDGGARWRPVDLHGELALSVDFVDVMRVTTTRGVMTRAGDALTPAPPPPSPPSHEDTQRAERLRRRVRDAAQARFGLRGARELTLPSGARVSLDEGLLAWTPPSGETSLGRVGGASCDALAPWGDGFAVLCERLLRGDASGRLVRVELPPNPRDEDVTVLSDDGLHAARDGACPAPPNPDETEEQRQRAALDAPEEGARTSAACVLEDGVSRWRTAALPESGDWRRWQVAGMHGAQLLLRLGDDDARWHLFDAAAGRGRDVTSDPPVAIRALTWLRDGSLVGVGASCEGADCTLQLLRGAPDAPLHPSPLPERTSRVAFADAARGLAVGDSLGDVWRTTDGAQHWEPVPVPEALQHVGVRRHFLAACDGGGCQVGTLLRVAGWGPLRADEARTVDVPGEPPEAPDARPRPASLTAAPLRCVGVGAPGPSPWRLPGGAARAVHGDGAWAFDPAGEHRTRVRWSGERGRGEAVVPFDLPERGASPGIWAAAGRSLLAAPDAPRLFEVRGATVRELPSGLLPDAFVARRFWSEGADAVPEGDALAVQATGDFAGAQIDLGLTLAATGAPTRRYALRGRVLEEPPTLALARRGGRWSRALVTADGVRVASPDGAEALLPGWAGALPVCAGAAPADAVLLRVVGCSAQRHCLANELLSGVRREVAEVELAPGGACLRALRVSSLGAVGVTRPDDSARPEVPVGWNLRAAAGGALAGFSDDGVHRVAVRCARPR
jgi:hypothetical protein